VNRAPGSTPSILDRVCHLKIITFTGINIPPSVLPNVGFGKKYRPNIRPNTRPKPNIRYPPPKPKVKIVPFYIQSKELGIISFYRSDVFDRVKKKLLGLNHSGSMSSILDGVFQPTNVMFCCINVSTQVIRI
jgi:hypothetical protein